MTDEAPAPLLDRCYLSAGAVKIVNGTVKSIRGPILPADPCDVGGYQYNRPHYEIGLQTDDADVELTWIQQGARPDEIATGDELLAGVREVDGIVLLRRFVFVDSPRKVSANSNLGMAQDVARAGLEPSCALLAQTDAELSAAIHAPPDIDCAARPTPPLREPWEIDDTI